MKGNSFSYVILLIHLTVASCEFHSSVHEVMKLVEYERYLLGKMEKFVTLNEIKLDFLKEKLSEFERDRKDAQEEGEEFFDNPINKYLLTKRLSRDWERIENFLDHEVGTSILRNVDKFRANYTFPDDSDFGGALEGLLRLQKIYRLHTKDIAQGILGGVKYTSELSASDCFDLGKSAFKSNELLAAHAWLLESLSRYDKHGPGILEIKFEKPDILEPLAEVKFKLGDYTGASQMSYALNLWRFNDTRLLEIHNNYIRYAYSHPSKPIEAEHEPIPDDVDEVDEFMGYQLTCSGHNHQLPSHERDLRCRYLTHTHPFLLIAPIKMEELHLDPLLIVFHEVLYDSEIEKVIEIANNKIRRSTVVSDTGPVVSNVRTSQFGFFDKSTHEVLRTIDERVADMTGLNMDSAEQHQIANYGIGGHYAQHTDFFHKMYDMVSNKTLGNRIATVLFYMTDVEQGGGTAFQYVKRLVKPEKGAAAFWYNLHANGDGDMWTKHGACPVLVGSKWVLNRWIRERGQEFKRPCDLENDSLDTSIKF